jgi:hypothetical protein
MNHLRSIERIDSGPAYMDKASDAHYSSSTLQADFLAAADKGDANALAPWAPFTTDWALIKSSAIDQRTAKSLPKRAQTLAECMAESLDYGNGPSLSEAMQLILNVATGCDESTTSQARRLLERMAESFAYHNED